MTLSSLFGLLNKSRKIITISKISLVYNYCTKLGPPSDKWQEKETSTDTNGEELYIRLRDYIYRHVGKVKADLDNTPDNHLLLTYVKHWNRFTSAAVYTSHLFRYLNRVWIHRSKAERSNVYEVHILALRAWLDVIFDKTASLGNRIVDIVLNDINCERNKEIIETNVIKQFCESLVRLGGANNSNQRPLETYRTIFENKFIEITQNYYNEFTDKFLQQNTITDYLQVAIDRLAEETNRVELYLDKTTLDRLISACEVTLIKKLADNIISHFKGLLENDKTDDLARMFILLNRISRLDEIKKIFCEHVTKQGVDAILKLMDQSSNPASNDAMVVDNEQGRKKQTSVRPADVEPKVYVEVLLSVYKKYGLMVDTAFCNEPCFIEALDIACVEYINRNSASRGSVSRTPELLAKYCDVVLKKSNKVAEEQDIESTLDDVMTVFKYVEDKDVFQKFYQKTLAKRLVLGMYASETFEEMMISKLKATCGYDFTSKLNHMFTDLRLSRDLNNNFREHLQNIGNKDNLIDFSVLVGGTAQWPLHPPTSNFNLPVEIDTIRQIFEQFYLNQHEGRRLNWLYHLGKVEVRANYCRVGKVPCTFILTNYQLGILLPFNDKSVYTWSELLEFTGLNEDAFSSQIKTLLKAKVLLLEGKVGNPDSKYELNLKLQSKKVRMKLDHPVRSEQKQESEDTHKTLEEDRKLVIQAAIVRIMKTRKIMTHSELVSEVISQLNSRFKLRIPDIKRSIDILLDKEYLERSATEKDQLLYVA